ncbi:MAG: GntR family transcriptional regulator [Pseudomonadota bacterium]
MSSTYQKIKSDVLARLMEGEWRAGETLPTEADMAAAYECARVTVNRALRELAEEGYLERRRKSGTRVRAVPERSARVEIPLIRDEVTALGATYGYTLVARAEADAPAWLADCMGCAEGAPVLHLLCLHVADGGPYLFEDRWICLDALPHAREQGFSEAGPNEWLIATIPFSNAEIGFGATAADEIRARHLQCAEGDALFEAQRSTWFDGAPVTYVRLTYRPGYWMRTRY